MTFAVSIAIDAGQTGMKIRVQGGGAAPQDILLSGLRTDTPILPQLAEATRAVLRQVDRPLEHVSAGVSGLTSKDADAQKLSALLRDAHPRQVMLAHDSVTSFLGTLGSARGAVIASGTGVVTLGVGRRRVARVDGWGNIMGDAGSGYWIGREGLDAVMRAFDNRGEPTKLESAVRERWPRLEDAYIDLQADPERVRIVASFARVIAELAPVDEVCAGICVHAGRELALSVSAALRQVIETDDPVSGVHLVSAIGGVFASPMVRSPFEDHLRGTLPGVHFEAAHGSGLDGVAALASLDSSHPLRTLVSVAGPAHGTPIY